MLRLKLADCVSQYIRNTFNAAKDNMSINGMDSREMEAEVAKAQEGEGQRVNATDNMARVG